MFIQVKRSRKVINQCVCVCRTVGCVHSVVPEPQVSGRPAACVTVANSNNTLHPRVTFVGGAKIQMLPRTRSYAAPAKGKDSGKQEGYWDVARLFLNSCLKEVFINPEYFKFMPQKRSLIAAC